jgi:hypothetical protein
MNITFTPEPIPELIITDGQLAALGFTPARRSNRRFSINDCGSLSSPTRPPGKRCVRPARTAPTWRPIGCGRTAK